MPKYWELLLLHQPSAHGLHYSAFYCSLQRDFIQSTLPIKAEGMQPSAWKTYTQSVLIDLDPWNCPHEWLINLKKKGKTTTFGFKEKKKTTKSPESTLYVQSKIKNALLTFHLLTLLCKGQVTLQTGTLPSNWYFLLVFSIRCWSTLLSKSNYIYLRLLLEEGK